MIDTNVYVNNNKQQSANSNLIIVSDSHGNVSTLRIKYKKQLEIV